MNRAIIFLASLAIAAACSRDQDEPPEQGTDDTGNADDTGPSEGTDTGDDTTPGTSGIDSSGDGSDDNGSESGTNCEGPDDCYACTPSEPTQFLNACTDAECEPFPNTQERLPLIGADGTLPPIP